MELKDVLQQLTQNCMAAAQLTDLTIGTVIQQSPLLIQTDPAMAPLQASVLLLTSAVIERKIPTLQHSHTIGGSTSSTALSSIACVENGQTLPVEDGFIILNRGLLAGDKVLLLRTQSGQRYIVLSRIYKSEVSQNGNAAG